MGGDFDGMILGMKQPSDYLRCPTTTHAGHAQGSCNDTLVPQSVLLSIATLSKYAFCSGELGNRSSVKIELRKVSQLGFSWHNDDMWPESLTDELTDIDF